MIHGTILREFYKLALAGNLTSKNLKHITKGLIEYLPPINELYKWKRAMIRAMCKPCGMIFKRFAAQLTEINSFILIFP